MNVRELRRTLGRSGTAAASVVAVMLVSGTAWAVWSTTGTGTGTSKATTLLGVTVSAGSAPSGQLYPGLTADGTASGGDINVSVTNTNPFPVTVTLTSIGGVTGCNTPAVTMGTGLPTSATSFVAAASSTSVAKTWTKVLSMGSTSSNDCQGASLSIPVNVSVVTN